MAFTHPLHTVPNRPQGVVQHSTINNLSFGRSVDETLRVLQALQCVQCLAVVGGGVVGCSGGGGCLPWPRWSACRAQTTPDPSPAAAARPKTI